MFKELMPLLRNRAVLMTLSLVEDDTIRVTVVPKKLKDDENAALTTPFMITGSAEELEAELGSTLVGYTGSHIQLKNTLQRAQEEMDAAAKIAKASAAQATSKAKAVPKKDQQSSGSTSAIEPARPSTPIKAEPAKPPSLFDAPPSEAIKPTNDDSIEDEEAELLAEVDDEEDVNQAA